MRIEIICTGERALVVEDFQSFAYAIANKLIREIADARVDTPE